MSIAKITEVSAQSPNSFQDAIQQGIARASKTIRNIQSAWIKEQQVIVNAQGQVANYRVEYEDYLHTRRLKGLRRRSLRLPRRAFRSTLSLPAANRSASADSGDR